MNNVEVKARYKRTEQTQEILEEIGAIYHLTEVQRDTYFKVEDGRLKIRESSRGGAQLIQYFRKDETGPRLSRYEVVHLKDMKVVRSKLQQEHGIWIVVKKRRRIWLWENIRIHFDTVEKLGDFIEFEAVLEELESPAQSSIKVVKLMKAFNLSSEDLIGQSYSDLLAVESEK